MWNIALIGQESSLNLTIQDILNQQLNYGCEFMQLKVLNKADKDEHSRDIDVIIADLTTHHHLPIRQIEKIRYSLPAVPIIVIHFLENSSIMHDFANAGANKVLSPDLSEDDLINTVHHLISEYS